MSRAALPICAGSRPESVGVPNSGSPTLDQSGPPIREPKPGFHRPPPHRNGRRKK